MKVDKISEAELCRLLTGEPEPMPRWLWVVAVIAAAIISGALWR